MCYLLLRYARLHTLLHPCHVHLVVDDQYSGDFSRQGISLPVAINLVHILALHSAIRTLRFPKGYYCPVEKNLEVFPPLVERIYLQAEVLLQYLNQPPLEKVARCDQDGLVVPPSVNGGVHGRQPLLEP